MTIALLKRAIQDSPSSWDEGFVDAPYFPVKEYQDRLDQIAGKYGNQSVLRLEWGGAERVLSPTKWANGVPIENEWRPKHAMKRKHEYLIGVLVFIPIRRWIITQWQTPHQLQSDVDETFTDETGTSNLVGKKPREGDYTPLIYIGDHSV